MDNVACVVEGRRCVSSGLGDDDGVNACGLLAAIAPRFSDFSGKSWESKFPAVMEKFYDACARVVSHECDCTHERRNNHDVGKFSDHGVVSKSNFVVGAVVEVGNDEFCATGKAGTSCDDEPAIRVCKEFKKGSDNSCTRFEPVCHGDSAILDSVRVLGSRDASVGPNVERNRINRAAQKERRNKRKELGQDWRKRNGGDMIKQDDSPGTFWNSTSNSVRQRLIDSKAEMHIAENERRTQEARDKIAYMKSPEATMRKAIGMIEFAEKQAKKENDSKVYGWAKTVATSSAESLARSTPDSVPSFDELSAKLAASSQSSFELELKAKQDEIDECNKKLEQESKRVFELERIKEQQVSKAKHDAVVNRMRQLEMEKNKNNSVKATQLDMNLAPSMKSSDQAYAKKSYIKQFGFYPYDLK